MALFIDTKFGALEVVEVSGDLPGEAIQPADMPQYVGVDTETSGLDWSKDKLGLVQIFLPALNTVFLLHPTEKLPSNLLTLLSSEEWVKVFHFALFDLRFLAARWDIRPSNIRCTKVASKLLSPEQSRHSLADLVASRLDISLSKDMSVRTSDWTAHDLSVEQLRYAALDAVYLPRLMQALKTELIDRSRYELAQKCFSFIPSQLRADLLGVSELFGY